MPTQSRGHGTQKLSLDQAGGSFEIEATKRHVLPNGLTLLLLENHRMPIVVAEAYVRAIASEITAFHATADALDADTIYFGGGTPSLLTPTQVETILEAVRKRFRVASDAEVTMEMNPGTLTLEGLRAFRALGVNRASFGAQTIDDTELKRLGRTHTAADVRRTIADLRQAGFTNVSFDLIAGLPAQTLSASPPALACGSGAVQYPGAERPL